MKDRSRGKRLWRSAIGAFGILLGVTSIGWFLWLPAHRPKLKPGERYGIDVSHHQGQIEWTAVAEDDIAFAYIKATEGGDFTDPRFVENWEASNAAGLARGAYHFFSLCTSGDAQARHFLTTVPDDPRALPPALDLELAGNCAGRPARSSVREEVKEFIRLVEARTGRKVLLYVGDDFEEQYQVRAALDRPLWHLRFLLRPNVDGWVLWQVMGFARIDGIDGRVDLDVARRGNLWPW